MPNEGADGKCAVCHRVLDWVTDLNGRNGHWDHTSQDKKLVDHAPVWASEKDGETLYRCDFCNNDHPEWEIPTKDFTILDRNAVSVAEWACCTECKALVEARRWEDLVNRVLVENVILATGLKNGTYTETTLRQFLRGMYGDLSTKMTGPIRPIT